MRGSIKWEIDCLLYPHESKAKWVVNFTTHFNFKAMDIVIRVF